MAAIFVADIVNGMRQQLGIRPVCVSEESVNTTLDAVHGITNDTSYNGNGHDVKMLSKYGLRECLNTVFNDNAQPGKHSLGSPTSNARFRDLMFSKWLVPRWWYHWR